jgi:short-subunit dehydrogenase
VTTSRPVVAITGVGRAAARAFAHKGFHVALLARGEERLAQAQREVEGAGVRGLALAVDVSDAGAVDDAASRIEETLGPIDVWVNSAMASVFSPVHELEADEVRRVAEVTYLGSVNGILAALRRMRARDRGTIVQVGSALAYRAIPLQASYCASKFAIRGFVDSLRCELLHDKSGVRITSVHMPALNTPQFGWVRSRLPFHPQPVPPIYQPEVAAKAIVWAAEHPRREYWIGYPTAGAIVANAVVPGLLDRYLARTNFQAQQTDQPVAEDRPDNLEKPVAGVQGAHGIFDDMSKSRSLQSQLSMHRRLAAGTVSGAGLLVLAARRRR